MPADSGSAPRPTLGSVITTIPSFLRARGAHSPAIERIAVEMRTLRYVLQIVLGIGLTLLVQRWDRRRLSDEQRARAWNTATWGAALYAFGPASMLGWGWVTRKSALGLLGGLLCAAALIAIIAGADYLFGLAAGLP